MAYRRSIIARTKLFYQQQRFAPSFSHISSRDREEQPPKSICRNSEIRSQFLRNYASNPLLSGNVTRLMRSEVPACYGLNFCRNLSNVPLDGAIGVKAAAPVVNEVAVAAADSFFPVAAFQHLIDYVHCSTGLEWWASIAATTLLIRFIHLPTLIFMPKFGTFAIPNFSTMIEAIRSEDMEKIEAFYHKIHNEFSKPVLQIFGYVMQYVNACLLFFAILNMAEKVPSFMTGGTLWFTDLTTPDNMYLPLLFALTFGFRFQLDPRFYQLGKKSSYNTLNVVLVGCGAVTAEFPTAIYCYGITNNLFFIAFGKLLMYPRVRKLLELPAVVKKSH